MKPLLAGKSILIAEDYPVMRKAIREMLYSLDADTILEADSGANVINALAKNSFDIVLCDYNLGAGKNGQQVLEEARFRKLITYNCIFIIIAADQTTSMVLGAMDSKPDEYLTKPFNAQQLYVRLERNLARKALLASIEKEKERGNLAQAIQQCDKLLTGNNKRMRTQLLKMRAELATLAGEFETGRRIYYQILQERDLPWARMGLGIIDFHQGNQEQALSEFADLLREHPLCMEAYDWLSKVYEMDNKLQEVQDVMHQAVDLSPQSLLRQKKLAQTAEKNGDIELAEKAYKAVVSLGKNSVHRSCSDFANLAKLYSKTSNSEQALQTLLDMRMEYVNSPEADLRAATLEAELYKNQGNQELAEKALAKALTLNTQLEGKAPKDLQVDLARCCFLQDQQVVAETILEGLIKTHIDDEGFLNDVRRMQSGIGMDNYSELLIQKTKRSLVATNNNGVKLYKQGKFKEAMELFETAMAAMPENKTIVINMMKIILHDLKSAEITEEKLLRAQALFKKAGQIGVEQHKLGSLQMEFSKILRRYTQEVNA